MYLTSPPLEIRSAPRRRMSISDAKRAALASLAIVMVDLAGDGRDLARLRARDAPSNRGRDSRIRMSSSRCFTLRATIKPFWIEDDAESVMILRGRGVEDDDEREVDLSRNQATRWVECSNFLLVLVSVV